MRRQITSCLLVVGTYRPILTAIGYHFGFNEDAQNFYNLALAMEIFHNFTLVHEMIWHGWSRSKTRCYMTVHKKYSPFGLRYWQVMMLIQAVGMIQAFAKIQATDVMDIFVKTATEVCEGQQLDMDFEKINEVYPCRLYWNDKDENFICC